MSWFVVPRARVVRGARRWLLSRDFALLWSGATISTLGSYLTNIGLGTLAVLTLRATPVQMSALVAVEALPTLALGLVAGVWVDRLRRRPLMVALDLSRALLLLLIPLAALGHWLSWGVLVGVALLVGLCSVAFDVAQGAYVPLLVSKAHLVEANSRLGASRAIAETGGPALAGGVIQALTPVGAMVGDALSYLISAACLGRMRHREVAPQPNNAAFWRDVRVGWQIGWGDPLLRSLTLATVTRSLGGGAFAALYTLFVLRTLHLSPLALGGVIAVGGAGGLLGALATPRVVKRWGMNRALMWAVALNGVGAGLTPLAGGTLLLPLLLLSQMMCGISDALSEVAVARLIAGAVAPATLGRVLAVTRVLAQVALPTGAVLAALLSAHIGLRLTLVAGSMVLVLASGWLMRGIRA